MGETVTLTAGQHVYHDDAIAHIKRSAVSEAGFAMISWGWTESTATDLDGVSTDVIVKRITSGRALMDAVEPTAVGRADIERAVGRLTMVLLDRVPDVFGA